MDSEQSHHLVSRTSCPYRKMSLSCHVHTGNCRTKNRQIFVHIFFVTVRPQGRTRPLKTNRLPPAQASEIAHEYAMVKLITPACKWQFRHQVCQLFFWLFTTCRFLGSMGFHLLYCYRISHFRIPQVFCLHQFHVR